MIVIDRKLLASKALERWEQQYARLGNDYMLHGGLTTGEVHVKLQQLGDNPKPEEIDKIMGNTSWTELKCSECNEYVEEIIAVGDDDNTVYLCKGCCSRAFNMLCK